MEHYEEINWKDLKSEGLVLLIYQISVEKQFHVHIQILWWMLPSNHDIRKKNNRTFNIITLSNLMSVVNSYTICAGTNAPDVNLYIDDILLVDDIFISSPSSVREKLYFVLEAGTRQDAPYNFKLVVSVHLGCFWAVLW